MAFRISVGGEFFDRIRQSSAYYVDKTEFLYELVHNTENEVALFTRPRRFGKTLTMTMIESFFDITRDSREVFRGLDITKHEEFCAEWMNRYPVMFLTLKDVEGRTFELAFDKLKVVIADLCKRISLPEGKELNPFDEEIFRKLKGANAEETDIQNSLKTLTRIMHEAYGRPVILLIDEYDVPLSKAQENGYYHEMLDVIRGLMSTALKTNDHLKFAVITGCLRIAKESIFTGVNNFASYSVLDERFSQYFGFTQEEVDKLLIAAGLEDKREVFREWYDGYIFGSTPMYCPWDVVSYASDLSYKSSARPKNYWRNTSGNGIIKKFISETGFHVKGKFETLMNGGFISQTITDQLTYDQLYAKEDNIWSVLLMTGYITKADPYEFESTVHLRLPNREIASIFQDTSADWFADTADTGKIQSLIDSLWNGDSETASKQLSDLLWDTISYMDYHENYYHAFLTGVFVGRGYEVESNKESGLGRPDIILKDHSGRRAMIIEAKKSSSEGQLEHDCNAALKQIIDKEYAEGLDLYDQVLCYGAAFYKKTALIIKG